MDGYLRTEYRRWVCLRLSCKKCGKREHKFIENPYGDLPAFQCLNCFHITVGNNEGWNEPEYDPSEPLGIEWGMMDTIRSET